MDGVLSEEDINDDEVLMECERELREMEANRNDKRLRESENSSEEGFSIVRRRPKRLIRSDSANTNNCIVNERSIEGEQNMDVERKYEVCISSLKILPKQMALARFLRDENISNIHKIKYKSPYRVFIEFGNKIQAEKLLKNQKLLDLDIRAQFTDQNNISYGIIKGVDLDIDEKELLENLNASCDIISAKRMRRINSDHEWVESETIRLSFKSISAPTFISAYGCKFAVEKYVFPVTQCSRCWRYGHIKRFCTLNKIICPKCGKEHSNCETHEYKCPNCKGPHMALNKSCPYFIKEKKIRSVMSEQNVTYKKALEIYLKKENMSKQNPIIEYQPINVDTIISNDLPQINTNKTYSSVLQATAIIHEVNNNQEDEDNVKSRPIRKPSTMKKKENNITKEFNQHYERQGVDTEAENFDSERVQIVMETEDVDRENDRSRRDGTKENCEKRKERSFDIWNLIFKIRYIVMSEDSFDNKCILVMRAIIEECKNFFSNGGILKGLFNLFNG